MLVFSSAKQQRGTHKCQPFSIQLPQIDKHITITNIVLENHDGPAQLYEVVQ